MTKKSTDQQLQGQASAADIKKWKELHGDIHYIIHDDKIVYFKPPTRTEVGYGMTYGAGNVLETAIKTMEVCFLGGAQELMEDDAFLSSAALRFDKLTQFKQVELGKL